MTKPLGWGGQWFCDENRKALFIISVIEDVSKIVQNCLTSIMDEKNWWDFRANEISE